MALAFNLFACNNSYSDIKRIRNTQLTPYVGRLVYLDNDPTKVYRVGRTVQAAFLDYASIEVGNYPITITITSIKLNGVEYITIPQSTSYVGNTQSSIYYPFIIVNTQCGYDENGYIYEIGTPPGDEPFEYGANFFFFIKSLIEDDLSLPIIVSKVQSNGTDTCELNLEGEQADDFYRNVIFEKDDSDSFEMTYVYNTTNDTPSSPLSDGDVVKYLFDGYVTRHYINEELTPSPESPFKAMSTDNRAFFSEVSGAKPTLVEDCVPVVGPFQSGSSTSIEDCCSNILITDTSNLVNNTLNHNIFGYRLIRVLRPDGTVYEYSSSPSDNPDAIISVLSDEANSFTYSFSESDTDGIWEVQVFNFPEWQADDVYSHLANVVVHKNDKLYKAVSSSVGVDPETDDSSTYWAEFDITPSTIGTRYGGNTKFIVSCLKLEGCLTELLNKAICGSDPCTGFCDNKDLMKYLKARTQKDALHKAECNRDWVSAKSIIETWKSICECVDC